MSSSCKLAVMLVSMVTLSLALEETLGQPVDQERLVRSDLDRQEDKSSGQDDQLKEYIEEWRAQRAREEEALNKLKEKQVKRELVDDDGTEETALMNYLFAKQVVNRLRSQMNVADLQRKRSYWKQCAFNAVSCFGK